MQFIVILYQLQITLYALLLGLFLGVLYDVLRITRMLAGITPVHTAHISWIGRLPVRRIGKIGKGPVSELLFVHLLDIVYGLSAGVCFCIFLYALNNGRFRWYLLLGCVLGFFAYYYSVGKLVLYLSGYIVAFLRGIMGCILYILTQPLIWVWRWVCRLLGPAKRRILRRQRIRQTEKWKKSWAKKVRFT
ncbi:MAG: hypothetical protein HFE66_07405 [Clostridiales bacterium]|jgi:hypothetical protein|nr:hypothetical protein [Clostridiales bacterium]